MLRVCAIATAATIVSRAGTALADPTVEVLNLGTSGCESAAIKVLKDAFGQGGRQGNDSAAGGDAMNVAMRSRHFANDHPDVAILKGPSVTGRRPEGSLRSDFASVALQARVGTMEIRRPAVRHPSCGLGVDESTAAGKGERPAAQNLGRIQLAAGHFSQSAQPDIASSARHLARATERTSRGSRNHPLTTRCSYKRIES